MIPIYQVFLLRQKHHQNYQEHAPCSYIKDDTMSYIGYTRNSETRALKAYLATSSKVQRDNSSPME